jgi:hypothetical protein
MPVGMMKIEYTEQSIHNNKNTKLTEVYKTYNHIDNDKKEGTNRTSKHFTTLHPTTLIDTSLPYIYNS